MMKYKNIFENVDYEGGFTIRGQNLLGAGTNEELAKVIFHYKDIAALLR